VAISDRAGEFSATAGVTDEQALDTLVVKVDEVNLQSVAVGAPPGGRSARGDGRGASGDRTR